MITQSRTAGMVTYNRRQRSLGANLSSVLLQPVVFFQAVPATRHWLWAALLILFITGFSAVHQPTAGSSAPTQEVPQVVMPPDGGVAPGISDAGGGFIAPPDGAPAPGTSAAPDVSKTVMTALLAAGGVLLAWFIQALVLCEVPMINGARPSFGLNLQIAIWASVPLALMLVIQQVYFAVGGSTGQLGLSLLLEKWSGFQSLPAFSQAVLQTLATNFTLFWLWSLALLYFAGRYALRGRRVAVLLVVVAWIIISTFVPALTSDGKTVSAEQTANAPAMEQMMPGISATQEVAPGSGEAAPPPRVGLKG